MKILDLTWSCIKIDSFYSSFHAWTFFFELPKKLRRQQINSFNFAFYFVLYKKNQCWSFNTKSQTRNKSNYTKKKRTQSRKYSLQKTPTNSTWRKLKKIAQRTVGILWKRRRKNERVKNGGGPLYMRK
jgi:hypothetical protein